MGISTLYTTAIIGNLFHTNVLYVVRTYTFCILIGCLSFAGMGMAAAMSEIWTIAAIAFERCRAIKNPLTRARQLNRFQVLFFAKRSQHRNIRDMFFQINCLIFGIWFIAITAAILPMWGVGSYVADVSNLAPF